MTPSRNRRARRMGAVRRLAVGVAAIWSLGAGASTDVPNAGAHATAIDRIFAGFVHPSEPGCAVGVMRQGALIHASAYGLADLAERKAIEPGSVFNIASISKQFTAFSILLLDERKALSLEDPLSKHVPELAAAARRDLAAFDPSHRRVARL